VKILYTQAMMLKLPLGNVYKTSPKIINVVNGLPW